MEYSVLMSVYAKEKPEYFDEAIQSILNQTVMTNDFVIVCDGPLTEELNAVLCKHAHHGRDALFNRARAVFQLDHRRVEPDGRPVEGIDALVPFLTFADDGRSDDVTRFQGMEEGFAVLIDQHGPEGADLFRH